MEYETYETEQTYDDMNGNEPGKTKVWIMTSCHNLHDIFEIFILKRVGCDFCDKNAHVDFFQLISLSLPLLSDLALEGKSWQTRAGCQQERFREQSCDWEMGGYQKFNIKTSSDK